MKHQRRWIDNENDDDDDDDGDDDDDDDDDDDEEVAGPNYSGGAERVSKSAPSANECCSRCRYYLPFMTNDHHDDGGGDDDDNDDDDADADGDENVRDEDEGNLRFTLYKLLHAMLGLRSATKPHFANIYLPIHFLA